jgi:hypothetical protein
MRWTVSALYSWLLTACNILNQLIWSQPIVMHMHLCLSFGFVGRCWVFDLLRSDWPFSRCRTTFDYLIWVQIGPSHATFSNDC